MLTTAELNRQEAELKRNDRATLEREVRRNRRVYDTRGCTKTDLVWLILEDRHGRKAIDRCLTTFSYSHRAPLANWFNDFASDFEETP